MKRLFSMLILVMLTLSIGAQENKKQQQPPQRFSPERFEAELQAYITKEANLTPQEAAKFFPVYKEMQEKQRVLFGRQSLQGFAKPQDEQGCLKSIKESDEIDLELKRIQQSYHLRFLELLPASKVYDILKAEQGFHRHMMRNWGRGNRQQNGQQNGQRPPQQKQHQK